MATSLLARRSELDAVLRSIVKARCGAENVYYQPPANLRMKYPCICYSRAKIRNRPADDRIYRQTVDYTITVIDTKPDSEMTAAVSMLEQCAHDRLFVSDNLYHDVFTLWK